MQIYTILSYKKNHTQGTVNKNQDEKCQQSGMQENLIRDAGIVPEYTYHMEKGNKS